MTSRLAALAAFVALAALPFWTARAASACPPPSAELLFHSCWGTGRLEVALLPEDLPLISAQEATRRLVVTGAYTARDTRDGGLPKPVGLFVHRGRVINPNLGRMDGVLIADPATGRPTLHHRSGVPLDGRVYDLTDLAQRRAFLAAAATAGRSVLQSHLLIVDGRIDIRPHDGAPLFVRRLLFADADGFGVYQTPVPVTLRDAAERLARRLAPRLAMNLDMGSYDYCQSVDSGSETGCGVLGRDDTAKLSNLLVFTLE